MPTVIKILFILLIVELIGAGSLIFRQVRQAAPLLPKKQDMDADTWRDLQDLAAQAKAGSSQNWLEFADALVGKGFYTYAEIAYRRSMIIDPNNLLALEGIAFCYDRTGRISESNEGYRQLLTQTDGEARQHHLYALAHNSLRLGNSDEAEDLFRQNAEFIPAKYMYCKMNVDAGRSGQVQPVIDTFLQALPRSLLFQRLKYRASLQLGQPDKAQAAADMAERSLRLIPLNFHTEFLTERDERYGFRRLFKEYQSYAEYLTPPQKQSTLHDLLDHLQGNLSPYTFIITKLLAEVAVEQKDVIGLHQTLQSLDDWGINDATTIQRRGDAYEIKGNRIQAVADWEVSVSMTSNVDLHKKLAQSYQAGQQTELCNLHLSQAALLEGQSAFRDDKLDQALDFINQSIAINPNNVWSWFYLAEIQRARLEMPAATIAYQKYLELNPTCVRPFTKTGNLARQ